MYCTCTIIRSNVLLLYLLQFNVLRSYLEEGGSVLVLLSEGGESKANTNINFLLEECGVLVNSGSY